MEDRPVVPAVGLQLLPVDAVLLHLQLRPHGKHLPLGCNGGTLDFFRRDDVVSLSEGAGLQEHDAMLVRRKDDVAVARDILYATQICDVDLTHVVRQVAVHQVP